MFPEIKNMVFLELKTVVSTGAPYSEKISKDLEDTLKIPLHNAYGTSETQQVLTTILDENFSNSDINLGKPLAGVVIGLKKFNMDSYELYVKSPFGHKYIIDSDNKEKFYPDEYYYTEDIVKIDENNNIYFLGRESRDYIKNGFGAKVPISFLKKNYEELYSQVEHIEYYTSETCVLYQGISALIFIKDKKLPNGRVTDKKTIRRITKIIKNTNKKLLSKVEPFEYDHMMINRFLILNSKLPKSSKGTVSKYKIDTEFRNEIESLIRTFDTKFGVKNIVILRYKIFKKILTCFPFNNSRFRKFFLKLFIRKN